MGCLEISFDFALLRIGFVGPLSMKTEARVWPTSSMQKLALMLSFFESQQALGLMIISQHKRSGMKRLIADALTSPLKSPRVRNPILAFVYSQKAGYALRMLLLAQSFLVIPKQGT